MGSDLPKVPPGAKAPSFLVAALKDPLFGNLDRIQIVKGWLDEHGEEREKIYEVVWGDAARRSSMPRGSSRPSATRWTWRAPLGRTRSAIPSSPACTLIATMVVDRAGATCARSRNLYLST
jgi:hypothetical protein